jgi:hypothetical protein
MFPLIHVSFMRQDLILMTPPGIEKPTLIDKNGKNLINKQ